MSDEYEIGYGKPPKKNQFKPGQSGNPSGKKAGKVQPKNVTEALAEALSKVVKVKVDGKIEKYITLQVLVNKLINQCINGEVKDKLLLFEMLKKLGLMSSMPNSADEEVCEPIYTEEDRRLLALTTRELGAEGND